MQSIGLINIQYCIRTQKEQAMTEQYWDQQMSGLNPHKRSKRRDLFQTAPISRNMLDTMSHQNQYKDELEQAPQKSAKLQRASSIPIPVFENDQLQIKKPMSQSQTTLITIKAQDGPETHPNEQKQKPAQTNNFIFEDSQQSDNEDKLQQTQLEKPSIIFQDNSHEEPGQEKTIEPDKPGKKTITLFGQKIQVDSELLEDQEQKNSQLPPKPKQLLKATTVIGENVFAKMRLTRSKASGGTIFFLSLEANSRFIMACKHTSSQTYILSESIDNFEQNGPHYVGKIKTTFFGNQLSLYSKGLNPQKAKQNKVTPRQLICTAITHSQQLMEEVKPRDFTVYLLKSGVSYYNDLLGTVMYEEEVPLHKLYDEYESNRSKILVYENRKSKWQQKQKMYSLNMKGRAKLPSIKNFILESPSEEGRDIVLLGKMEENEFSLDIHHPISPSIGLTIALTSFVHKSW